MFRQDCKFEFGSYSKDLFVVNNDLSRVFILDNSPIAYRSFPLNAIPSNSKTEKINFLIFICLL